MSSHYTDIATRALVVALKCPIVGKSTTEIAEATGLNPRMINNIYAGAIRRGFNPNAIPLVVKDEYLQDAPRTGRPSKQSTESPGEDPVEVAA
ncbi:hypothetical protein F5884DRAFT_781746 [Xylogone sp. PMI_703]|nr:hypothetical protein F5884DRAFT_781746 [Xylogone sp. PMI_703]